jgi:rhodanese-related sulfurtransferase
MRALLANMPRMDKQLKHYEDKLAYEIDGADLAQLLAHDAAVVVIDTRAAFAYAEGHIPGAISLPHRVMDAQSTAHLDRAALIVTYCDGIGCNGSTKGALNMTRLGFRVKELIGGFDWWRRDGHAAASTEGGVAAVRIGCAC